MPNNEKSFDLLFGTSQMSYNPPILRVEGVVRSVSMNTKVEKVLMDSMGGSYNRRVLQREGPTTRGSYNRWVL